MGSIYQYCAPFNRFSVKMASQYHIASNKNGEHKCCEYLKHQPKRCKLTFDGGSSHCFRIFDDILK